jgi:GMP synthase (glutamine-hydrolysing)
MDLQFLKRLLAHPTKIPILGICYGFQLLAKHFGHEVKHLERAEYGPDLLRIKSKHPLFDKIPQTPSQVWMSHADHVVLNAPKSVRILAESKGKTLAAVDFAKTETAPRIGVQFHPEVSHSTHGRKMLHNFVKGICKAKPDWNPTQMLEDANAHIQRDIVGPGHAGLCAVSGGVDSTVLAKLLASQCPKQVHFIHVDHGLGRHQESLEVVSHLRHTGVPVKLVRSVDLFLSRLKGIEDPEQKRKIIGHTFVDVFEDYAKVHGLSHLIQGTLYPDKIESSPQVGQSSVIKTHHNVGGLPKTMSLKVVEPFEHLYKDDVRKLGAVLKVPKSLLGRHPFPGPGLAIRILGEVSAERLELLRACDHVMTEFLKKTKWYDQIWQSACILLPVHSVGVKGDQRVYQPVVAIRCVMSENAMTAQVSRIPTEILEDLATLILNTVAGVGRVVYDISPKPPATIEWE